MEHPILSGILLVIALAATVIVVTKIVLWVVYAFKDQDFYE